jgi:tRNA pseudouridine13 synthase
VSTLPYLTAELPPAGGQFKASPEDFMVEELPAYEPNGEAQAEHLFVWIEKRGHSTQDVAKALARHCGVQERDLSWAGLKDRNAVTRQYLCGPARFLEPKLGTFAMEGVTVLKSARHRNKLKGGHLAGNRFRIVVRGVERPEVMREGLGRLQKEGLPNFFGEQRFGLGGMNAARGRKILEAGGRHRDRFERKLLLSAFQSDLFNRVLAARLTAREFTKVLRGDVLKKHETGGEFVSEDPTVDQPRLDAFEVSPTGPLFGPEMRKPGHDAAEREGAVLAEQKVELTLFEAGGDETRGTRRLLRIPFALEGVTGDRDVELTFTLPAGSYATVVLRELLKGE